MAAESVRWEPPNCPHLSLLTWQALEERRSVFGKRNIAFLKNKRIRAPVSFLQPACPLTEPRVLRFFEVGARPADVSSMWIWGVLCRPPLCCCSRGLNTDNYRWLRSSFRATPGLVFINRAILCYLKQLDDGLWRHVGTECLLKLEKMWFLFI